MKAQLLMLSAAGLLFAAETGRAAPNAIDRLYLAGVSAQADARLANAGVTLPTPTVKVRALISGDRLEPVRVESTGDLGSDRAVEQALRGMRTPTVPSALAGRALTFTLAAAPAVQAR